VANVFSRIQKAKALKEEGNVFFKNQDVKSALRQYHFAWLNIKVRDTLRNVVYRRGLGRFLVFPHFFSKGLGENAMSLAGPSGG
jgi:hypothetical protein